MKVVAVFIGLITLFITLPIGVYMSWLLYKHVQATDFMWFLWWMYWPLVALLQIFGVIATKSMEKK